MKVEDIIYKVFRDNPVIWFDYIDHVKCNFDVSRKGLRYEKKYGRFNFYVCSEEGEEILMCSVTNEDGYKVEKLIDTMKL